MSTCPPNCIPIKEALGALDYLTADLDVSTKKFARKELKSMLTALYSEQEFVEIDNLKHFMVGFKDAIETGDASSLVTPRGLRVKRVVTVDEFVENKYFLGMKGAVWPSTMEILWDVFHGPNSDNILEVVLGGATGVGKSMLSDLGISYLIYKLSCYHSPQEMYSLAPGTSIYFLFQSVNLRLAKKVLFEQFAQRIRQSEYFRKNFPFAKEITTELRFPNNIVVLPISSTDTSALGLTVFAAAIDELCFMDRVENSARAKYNGDSEYDQASSLYDTMVNRIQSRFMRHGHVPGKLFLASSANYPDDFVSKKIQQFEQIEREGKRNHIYVSVRSRWDAWPKGTFSSETFPVEVGDNTRRSRVLNSVDEAVDPGSVYHVPIDFKASFSSDCEKAIREILGHAVGNSGAFIKEREKIYAASKEHLKVHEGKSLFKMPSVDLTYYDFNLGALFNDEYIDTYIDPLAEYFVHLDLAVTGDSCGLSVGHLAGFKECGKSFEYDEGTRRFVETKGGQLPIIVIDGALEIVPPQDGEIDFIKIGNMLDLLAQRINVTYVTADSFQSVMMLQRMRKVFNCKGAKVKAAKLSVDLSMAPYALVKQALTDGRLLYPDNDRLMYELSNLQLDPVKEKVDHPPRGCFTGDTRVALLDGTNPTFEELCDMYAPGEVFYVYSIGKNGGVTVGEAVNPRLTIKNSPLVEVTLDNYGVIRCTPDHLFMTLDGDWIQAQNLTPDISLMPLYRSRSSRGGWRDYERLYDPKTKNRIMTHQMVSDWKYPEIVRDSLVHSVHHIDKNRGNNSPDNLELSDRAEHARSHTQERHDTDSFYVEKLRDGHKRYRENGGNEKSRENMLRLYAEGKLKRGREVCAIEGCSALSNARGLCDKHYQAAKRAGNLPPKNHRGNHKVISVKELPYTMNVYDLTVLDLENFALTAGVFVHNSKDISDSVAGVVYAASTIGTRRRTLNSSGDGSRTFRRIRSGRRHIG